MSKTKVLLVDDHTIVREGIKSLLETQENLEVVGEAEDGMQAVKKAKQLGPDIIVIDFAMPNLSGLEATYKIKKTNPKAKILVLTVHDNEEYIYQILKVGASGYLLKDSAASDLVSAIDTVRKGNIFLSPSVYKMVFNRLYKVRKR